MKKCFWLASILVGAMLLPVGRLQAASEDMVPLGLQNERDYHPLKENYPALEDMVFIAPGEFEMGGQEGSNDETPIHKVLLDGYLIGKYEVTNYAFAKFIEETGYKTQAEKSGFGWVWRDKAAVKVSGATWRHPKGPGSAVKDKMDHPVTQVSWTDAEAYCRWRSEKDKRQWVLPTEAQWERAARGGKTEIVWPWGNKWNPNMSNCWAIGFFHTVRAGMFPPNFFGIYDMAGNVWEWCQDRYSPRYYKESPRNNPSGPVSTAYPERVLRGGSFDGSDDFLRVSSRFHQDPRYTANFIGFRAALLPPAAKSQD